MQGIVASLLPELGGGEDGLSMEFRKACEKQTPGFQAPGLLHFLRLGRIWEVFSLGSVRGFLKGHQAQIREVASY